MGLPSSSHFHRGTISGKKNIRLYKKKVLLVIGWCKKNGQDVRIANPFCLMEHVLRNYSLFAEVELLHLNTFPSFCDC